MLTATEPRLPDVALIRAAQSGDRAAFGRLYEQYEALVHGILIAHVAYDDVADLSQDVFLKAMEQLPRLRDPAAFGGWLIVITRRVAADHCRSRRITVAVDNIPAQAPRRNAEALAILDTIRRLPEAYRETLILRLVEGMTGPEIAVRTGLKPESVRVNLCRGMKLLRDLLQAAWKVER